MVPVIFETEQAIPLRIEDLLSQEKEDRWCLDLYGCTPLVHGVSASGLRALCLYEAPDAEAVRRAVRHLGAPDNLRAWTAASFYRDGFTRRDWPWTDGPLAISRHEPPAEFQSPDVRPAGTEAEPLSPGNGAIVIADFVSLDRTRAIRLYAAPDLEAVRQISGPLSRHDLFAAVPHSD